MRNLPPTGPEPGPAPLSAAEARRLIRAGAYTGQTAGLAIRAVQITSRFPSVHGAPVHIGLPQDLGIADLQHPDFGDPVELRAGELPVFWACGVTPQVVVEAVKPPFFIAHYPGAMLITDLLNAALATS